MLKVPEAVVRARKVRVLWCCKCDGEQAIYEGQPLPRGWTKDPNRLNFVRCKRCSRRLSRER
jgi:hypothetical protein